MTTFQSDYAEVYDRLYAQKEYSRECDLIESAAASDGPMRILDLGCGTGGHALTLARRGHAVVGVDRSDAMIDVARKKAAASGLPIEWQVGDIVDVDVHATFDVVTFMFAVLGYLLETDEVAAALRNARRHLDVGGTLVFDVWNGPAVLSEQPAERARVFPQEDGMVIRLVHPVLRPNTNSVDVGTRLLHVRDDRVVFDLEEIHSVRYFFVPELEQLLHSASFGSARFFDFPDVHASPRVDGWNLGCVATAV